MPTSLAALHGTEALLKLRLFRFSLVGLPTTEQQEKWAPDCLVALGCSNFRDCYQLSSILGAAHSVGDRVPHSPGIIVIGDCCLDCVCSSHLEPVAKKEVCFRHSLLRHLPAIPGPIAAGNDARNWRLPLENLLEQLISVQPTERPQLIVLNGVCREILREVLQVIQTVWSQRQPACKILLTSTFDESDVGILDPEVFSAVSRPPSVAKWTCETEFVETVIESFRLGEIQLCKDMLLSRTKAHQRSCLPLAFLRRKVCWEFDGFGFDSDFDNSFLELFSCGVLNPVDFVAVADTDFFVLKSTGSFIKLHPGYVLPASMQFTQSAFQKYFRNDDLKRNRFLNYLYILSVDDVISNRYRAVLYCLSLERQSRGKLFHFIRYCLSFYIYFYTGDGAFKEFTQLLGKATKKEQDELLPDAVFGQITDPAEFNRLAVSWLREGFSEGCPACAYGCCYIGTSGFENCSLEIEFPEQVADNILRLAVPWTAFDHFYSIYSLRVVENFWVSLCF